MLEGEGASRLALLVMLLLMAAGVGLLLSQVPSKLRTRPTLHEHDVEHEFTVTPSPQSLLDVAPSAGSTFEQMDGEEPPLRPKFHRTNFTPRLERPIGSTRQIKVCPPSPSTAFLPPCPRCSCKYVETQLREPPVPLTCEEAATKCDGDSVPYCFQEWSKPGKEWFHDAQETEIWQLASDETIEQMDLWKDRPRRECTSQRVIAFGDSHARLRIKQMMRIFRRKGIVGSIRGEYFVEQYHDMAKLLEDKVLCPNDVLVLSTLTMLWTPSRYTALLDTIIGMVRKYSLKLIWFPQGWLSPHQPTRTDADTDGSLSSRSVSGILREQNKITKEAVKKYSNEPNVVVMFDIEYACTETLCNLNVPKSRTLGFRDQQHYNWHMSLYMEPFVCAAVQKAGFL